MLEALAQILYERDVVKIGKEELQVSFHSLLAYPGAMEIIGKMAAEILDDYAIDSISCVDEGLPICTFIAKELDLPLQWIGGDQLFGSARQGEKIERTMFVSLVSPLGDGRKNLIQAFEKFEPELVGIFTLLSIENSSENSPILDLKLCSFAQILEIYHQLYLITESEHENLVKLYQS